MEWMKVKMMADRQREEIRAEMETTTGMYLTRSDEENSGDEDEQSQEQGEGDLDPRYVSVVTLHGVKRAHGGEEAAESEPSEEDAEVEVGEDGYEAEGDWDGGCSAEHLPGAVSENMKIVEVEVEEEPEESDGFETDYGSVEIACEDEEPYKNLNEEDYDQMG